MLSATSSFCQSLPEQTGHPWRRPQAILDTLCPVEASRARRHLCAVLVARSGDPQPARQAALRQYLATTKPTSPRLRYAYIYMDKQAKFLSNLLKGGRGGGCDAREGGGGGGGRPLKGKGKGSERGGANVIDACLIVMVRRHHILRSYTNSLIICIVTRTSKGVRSRIVYFARCQQLPFGRWVWLAEGGGGVNWTLLQSRICDIYFPTKMFTVPRGLSRLCRDSVTCRPTNDVCSLSADL